MTQRMRRNTKIVSQAFLVAFLMTVYVVIGFTLFQYFQLISSVVCGMALLGTGLFLGLRVWKRAPTSEVMTILFAGLIISIAAQLLVAVGLSDGITTEGLTGLAVILLLFWGPLFAGVALGLSHRGKRVLESSNSTAM